jgi:hypothetical protein
MRSSPDTGGEQGVSKIEHRYDEEVLLHGSQRPVQESYLISQLRFQVFSLAVAVLALASEFRHAFCVAADFATEFFPLRGDTVARWMGTF